MTATRRLLLAAACLVALGTAVHADNYPNRSVKFVLPFGAGGPADVFARVLAEHMSQSLKQSFVVENRPGAGSIIGTEAVHQSAPDGYTLLLMSNTHTTNESLVPNKPFQLMRDFVPVAPINYSDLLMVVHPSVEAKTLQIVHVPHKAPGDAPNSVLGGHVQMMFDAITTMRANAEAGKVRALATTGQKRSPLLPNVPTVAEAGVPGYEATIWLGVMAPKGTPPDVVKLLNTAINKVIDLPAVKDAWAKQGAIPMHMTIEEFDAYLKKDIEKWARVVKVSGATVR